MTDTEIEAQREALVKAGGQPHVESPYADWTLAQAQEKLKAGATAVVRFKTKTLKKDYIFTDLVRGEVSFPSDMVSDFVLLRSGGMPVYNFCNVIDDHLMEISHVLRAEEHLPNTLRQLMIYEALNWAPPEFGHMSLILDEDRKKLSKRTGATSCHEFKMEGYLPEALNNFIALLGWTHPEEKEIISMHELIEKFNVHKMHPAGAVFNAVKLKWVNASHLRALPEEKVWELMQPFFVREGFDLPKDQAWQKQSVVVFKPAMETFLDAVELYRPLSDKSYTIQPEAEETLKWEQTRAVLTAWRDVVAAETETYMTEARFLQIQDLVKEKSGAKGKNLFMPMRVAVIGKPHGTELKILAPLIAKSSLVARAEMCLKHLG
jgi:nondiscriminating glutamyl-tRNA synthetase